jgi:hypothetical protein
MACPLMARTSLTIPARRRRTVPTNEVSRERRMEISVKRQPKTARTIVRVLRVEAPE